LPYACAVSRTSFICSFRQLCDNENLGAFYKYVNKKLNGSNGIVPLKDKNNTLVSDDSSKAELPNDYFCSIFTQDNGIINKEWQLPASNSTMNPVFVTPDLVQKCIKRLKASGGAGPDNLPSEFYKHCQRFIVFPLSVIFNISLQTRLLPPIWKSAIVTLVFKKGSPSDPADYRPISVTCIACTLLESCVKDGLLTYLMTHNIITRDQHSFLSKKSTINNFLNVILIGQLH